MRPGAPHQWPDTPSRLPLSDALDYDMDDLFRVYFSTRTAFQGPRGAMLDGVLVRDTRAWEVDPPAMQGVAVVARVLFTPRGRHQGKTPRP